MADNIKISLTRAEGVVLATEGKYCDKNIAVTPNLATKSFTENGTYSIPEGYAGYGEITVEVDKTIIPEGYIKPEGELEIVANGTHNVTNYESVVVSVPSEEVEEYTGTVTIIDL